jgi:hypothetical protein
VLWEGGLPHLGRGVGCGEEGGGGLGELDKEGGRELIKLDVGNGLSGVACSGRGASHTGAGGWMRGGGRQAGGPVDR